MAPQLQMRLTLSSDSFSDVCLEGFFKGGLDKGHFNSRKKCKTNRKGEHNAWLDFVWGVKACDSKRRNIQTRKSRRAA